jgi:hypothetical protein
MGAKVSEKLVTALPDSTNPGAAAAVTVTVVPPTALTTPETGRPLTEYTTPGVAATVNVGTLGIRLLPHVDCCAVGATGVTTGSATAACAGALDHDMSTESTKAIAAASTSGPLRGWDVAGRRVGLLVTAVIPPGGARMHSTNRASGLATGSPAV